MLGRTMVVPLLAGILAGFVMLIVGLYQAATSPQSGGKVLAVIGGLILFGAFGLLVFSLFVFASGM